MARYFDRNRKFAITHSIYIAFALVMAFLNFNWTIYQFNWYGWVWVASLPLSIIELIRIYRKNRHSCPAGEITLPGERGVCQLTDISVPEVEELSVEESVKS